MITLNQYVGPHRASPDWTPAREQAAIRLLGVCEQLEMEMLEDGVVFPINPKTGSNVSGTTFGGFRPQSCPQGSPNSSHKEGSGIDRFDPHEDIDNWCMTHQARLKFHEIYIEHPDKTPGWSHWTTRAPGSGNTVFWP